MFVLVIRDWEIRGMFESAKTIWKRRLANGNGEDIRTGKHVAFAWPTAKQEEK